MNKAVLTVILILLTLGFAIWGIICAIKGDKAEATFWLILALLVHSVGRSYLA